MPKLEVPLYSMGDYPARSELDGVYVCRFEKNIRQVTNRIGLHRHGYFELFLMEGHGEHTNDFRVHSIKGPSLIFVSPGQVHAWTQYRGLRGIMVAFTQEFFDGRCQPPSELLQFPFWFPADASPVRNVPADAFEAIQAGAEDILSEFEAKCEGFENVIRWLLRVLFTRAARIGCNRAVREKSYSTVRDFRVLLETRFRSLQKVSEYARLLGLSSDRLSELTREQTGFSAGELIRRRLMLEAQRMLAHTELTMSEIAYDLNFQDPSYFSRFFRKQTGQSPGDFRAALRVES